MPNPEAMFCKGRLKLTSHAAGGSKEGRSVYFVVGSPWWLSSPHWRVQLVKLFFQAVSLLPVFLNMLHFLPRHIHCPYPYLPLTPSSGKGSRSGTLKRKGPAILCSGCGRLLHLSLLAQGSTLLPTAFLCREVFNHLMLPTFCLDHVHRIWPDLSVVVNLGHWRVTWLHWTQEEE